jgi:t-SNARE complex subunit (syntaxin)
MICHGKFNPEEEGVFSSETLVPTNEKTRRRNPEGYNITVIIIIIIIILLTQI